MCSKNFPVYLINNFVTLLFVDLEKVQNSSIAVMVYLTHLDFKNQGKSTKYYNWDTLLGIVMYKCMLEHGSETSTVKRNIPNGTDLSLMLKFDLICF